MQSKIRDDIKPMRLFGQNFYVYSHLRATLLKFKLLAAEAWNDEVGLDLSLA